MTATVDHNDHDKTADVIGNYTQYHTFMCVVLLFGTDGLTNWFRRTKCFVNPFTEHSYV